MENGWLIGSVGSSGQEPQVKVVTTQNKINHSTGKEKHGNSFYVGDMRSRQEAVSDRFARAQKSAIKRILDQFEEDNKIDGDMEAGRERAAELAKGVVDSFHQLNALDERRAELMKEYEVAPDSQEQKDLELRQKANAAQKNPFDESLQLTPEEQQRLADMPPLTDYQEAMLLCDKEEEQLRDTINRNRQNIKVENATIQATEKALLKVHPMVEAMKDAKEIMENALKEQISDLFQEGVDKVDSDMAESREEMAEAQAEALEEKIEREKIKEEDAAKEERQQELQGAIFSATMQAVSNGQQASGNMQANIKSLIQDQIVLDVDLKGLRVDKQV